MDSEYLEDATLLDEDLLYEQVTREIRVRVLPEYCEDQSSPEESYYFWTYTVEILNEGEETVKLNSRVWKITDGTGRIEEVRGEGVVGKTPVIPPGEAFTYTSGCPLSTSSGIMVGSYQMVNVDTGRLFDIEIPAFSLDSPYALRSVN